MAPHVRRIMSLMLAAGCLLTSPGRVGAQSSQAPTEWKRRFENAFAFVANPLGIQDGFEASWTKEISHSDAPLFRDAHVSFGASSKLTPAFERVAGWFEYSPLSVLDLRVGVEPVYYFGTYKAFLPFDRANARFDDDLIEARVKEAASGFANRFYFSPTLKMKAGSVVARVHAEVATWKAEKKGDPFFYEPAWDTLIKASGSTVITVEALGLRETHIGKDKTLLLGPVYDLTNVTNATANRKQDVGLLAVWTKSTNFHALKDPTIAAKAIYFLQDPWRRHQPALQLALVFGL